MDMRSDRLSLEDVYLKLTGDEKVENEQSAEVDENTDTSNEKEADK